MTTKALLDSYYHGFRQKQGWENVISEDFKFVGGDMTMQAVISGKQAYINIIKNFSKLFQSMQPIEMIIEGDSACVIERYNYAFPSGIAIDGNVAAIWKVKDDKLDSLTIYFDTSTFRENMK
jgi:ketosteroid isomerase-like protein